MLYEIFQLLSSTPGSGGLFDFGATLPLMAIQFLVLMVVLDSILYSPLLTTISEREEYVQVNLKKAAELIEKANQIKMAAEKEIATAEQASQINIAKYTKESKEVFDGHIKIIQKNFNDAIEKATANIRAKQTQELKALKSENEAAITKKILSILLD
jgi:F-type H+-transporting ATPase subunit b